MRKKFKMYLFEEVVANTLRIFGQGMKVACEITLMAADAGLVRTDEDVIAIGGTSHGGRYRGCAPAGQFRGLFRP